MKKPMLLEDKKQFKKGDFLMHEGDAGDCAYIIETGSVEVLVQRGDHVLQVGTRGVGSIVGEMAVIDDRPRTATIRALEDCDVLIISRDDFVRRVDAVDPIIKMVLHVIMTRYRDLMARTKGFAAMQGIASVTEDVEKRDQVHAIALNTIKVDHELRNALANSELLLYYQPIIDIQNLSIAGFEALMRWKHPQKGMISPGIFIPVAEESGFIVELTKWALEEACRDVGELQKSAANDVFMSVNVSVKDFSDKDFFERLESTLKKTAALPHRLHLEITEGLLMEEPEAAKDVLKKCYALGIHTSIDDFGTGYSSLGYLHAFPVQALKIDQSFIRSMSSHEASLVLVKSIIGLARNLKMKIIAEGIETASEAKMVRDLGCDFCQGFWFSKPLPLEDALKFQQSWKKPII